jgi:hypothetical protein
VVVDPVYDDRRVEVVRSPVRRSVVVNPVVDRGVEYVRRSPVRRSVVVDPVEDRVVRRSVVVDPAVEDRVEYVRSPLRDYVRSPLRRSYVSPPRYYDDSVVSTRYYDDYREAVPVRYAEAPVVRRSYDLDYDDYYYGSSVVYDEPVYATRVARSYPVLR